MKVIKIESIIQFIDGIEINGISRVGNKNKNPNPRRRTAKAKAIR